MLLGMREVEYDGLNRRIRKVVTNCGDGLVPGSDDLDGNGTPDATGIPFANRSEHYYYAGWRVIEERDNNGSTGRVLAQTVYGTEYIDEPVCRDRNLDVSTDSTPAADDCLDGSGGTTGSTRYFYHQDANYRVAALTNESGTVVERYEYEAYGEPRVYVGQPAGGTYESGALVSTSYVGNPLMHQGLRRDDETGLHENRFRMLHSRLGRFMQRDPLEYREVLNLYLCARAQTTRFVDPLGLFSDPARVDPANLEYCKKLARAINEVQKRIYKRTEDIKTNPQREEPLPETDSDDDKWPRRSVRGHRWLIGQDQQLLGRLMQDFKNNCGGKWPEFPVPEPLSNDEEVSHWVLDIANVLAVGGGALIITAITRNPRTGVTIITLGIVESAAAQENPNLPRICADDPMTQTELESMERMRRLRALGPVGDPTDYLE